MKLVFKDKKTTDLGILLIIKNTTLASFETTIYKLKSDNKYCLQSTN